MIVYCVLCMLVHDNNNHHMSAPPNMHMQTGYGPFPGPVNFGYGPPHAHYGPPHAGYVLQPFGPPHLIHQNMIAYNNHNQEYSYAGNAFTC